MEHLTKLTSVLDRPTVHMKDREHVLTLVRQMAAGGKDKLQVIADFDMTMSRFSKNGHRCVTCHKALDDSPYLPKEYRDKANAMRNFYYPREIDPSIPDNEKHPVMVEWWTRSHNLLIEYGLNREGIYKIVAESELLLRDGCGEMLKTLNAKEVPLLVFSAGLGDIIHACLHQQAAITDNLKIVSNFMEFDNKGEILGFKGTLIHSLNKNESAIHESDYFPSLASRENVVLLGDSLGDLRMAEGAEHMKGCLKIGFLNDKVSERLDSYINAFDIVLVSDETMDVPSAILAEITR